MSHLLVTNDFPPKIGGIQSYLWELWRRLPPHSFTVMTTPYPGSSAFDAHQPFAVVRTSEPMLLPTPGLTRRVRRLADEVNAGVVVLDPALPLGLIGPRLGRPYAVVLHGAEVTVPAHLPATRQALAHVLRRAEHVIAASTHPAAESHRITGRDALPVSVVFPGADVERFRPLSAEERAKTRADLGLEPDGQVVVAVTRLVPRKGMDTLIEAAALLAPRHPGLAVVIAGDGRDRARLERLARRRRAPVRLLGSVPYARLPAVHGCADVFAMPCRERWGGLDNEGFGVVFLEAAACGVPQVAGASGGSADAVADGHTGFVVDDPGRPEAVATALGRLLEDGELRRRMGEAARRRAVQEFSYDSLAIRLGRILSDLGA